MAARVGAVLFRYRGFLPVPFLLIPLLVPGVQTRRGWEISALFILAGEAFRLAGVSAAGTVTRRRSRAVQRLVTYGIFAWMRNPLYVGNFLALLGVVLWVKVWWLVAVFVLAYALYIERVVTAADRAVRGGRTGIDLRQRVRGVQASNSALAAASAEARCERRA